MLWGCEIHEKSRTRLCLENVTPIGFLNTICCSNTTNNYVLVFLLFILEAGIVLTVISADERKCRRDMMTEA